MNPTVHARIKIRPDRINVPLERLNVGLFGSAMLVLEGIPDDVTEPRIVLTSPGNVTFEVQVDDDGNAYVEPGMLDVAGSGSYYVLATDTHGNQTPLGSGAVNVMPYPASAPGAYRSSAIPVSSVMDANGTSRRLLAVQDEFGNWTLTVGEVVENSFKLVDPAKLPEEATEADSLEAVKAKVNAIRSAVRATCLAFAALPFFLFGAATLNKLPGTAEVYTAPEVDAKITDAVTNAVQDAFHLAETDPTVPQWAKAETAPVADFSTNNTELVETVQAVSPTSDFTTGNAELVATIEATAPAPGNYATVSNAAMTALQSYTETDPTIGLTNGTIYVKGSTITPLTSHQSLSGYVPTTRKVNNKALSADITLSASEVGAYSSTDGTILANIVNTWEGYWDGTNVIFEVTNYYGNTSGEIPRLRIKELREGAWRTVWDEADKFQVCETNIMSNVVAYVSGEVGDVREYAAENFAPLAWGTVTDKGTTNVVGNSVWMTAPETYFAGGTEYQRVAVGSGSICVLTDNGALAKTVGEPGTFRFQDEGGTNYFGFAKSESYTIGCRTDGISVDGTLVTLRYDVIMGGGDVPIVYWRQSLTSGEWVQLNNADGTATEGAPYTVTWYTSGGSLYAAINCGANASGFFKAETSVAGDVVFETNMKLRVDGGLECTNTSTGVMGVIRPTFNGSTVIWNWSAR